MKLLYFAHVALITGRREDTWDIDRPVTQEELWEEIERRYPAVRTIRASCRVASDGRYLGENEPIRPESESAILPPVSGG